MSLGLYLTTTDSDKINSDNTLSITFDGRVGGAISRLLYLRNNERSKWYENITLTLVDTSGTDLTDNSVPGWYWKLAESDMPLNNLEWEQITAGAPLSLFTGLGTELLADIHTYIPIWIYIHIPRNQPIQTIKDIKIRISARENLI